VSGAGGVDVLVNYLGGETWIDALRCVRRDGRILVCGATLGHAPANDLRYLWSFEHRIIGSNGWTPDDQRQLLEWVASGQLRPEIHEVAPLAELPRLMQALIERAVIGKAVLCP
jgi:alcohol dehydrogenase